MLHRCCLFAAALLVIAATGRPADADISYLTDRTTYYVAPGDTAVVHVWARFDGPDLNQLVAENGLYSIGVSLITTSSSPMNMPALLADLDAVALNLLDFDDSFGPLIDLPFSPRFGAVLLADPFAQDGDLGVMGTPSEAARLISIGSFAYTASASQGEGTTIVIDDHDPELADIVTWRNSLVLDNRVTPTRIGIVVTSNPACPADFNADGVLNTQDFFEFMSAYFDGRANFDGLDGTNSQDFFAFLTAFFNPC